MNPKSGMLDWLKNNHTIIKEQWYKIYLKFDLLFLTTIIKIISKLRNFSRLRQSVALIFTIGDLFNVLNSKLIDQVQLFLIRLIESTEH